MRLKASRFAVSPYPTAHRVTVAADAVTLFEFVANCHFVQASRFSGSEVVKFFAAARNVIRFDLKIAKWFSAVNTRPRFFPLVDQSNGFSLSPALLWLHAPFPRPRFGRGLLRSERGALRFGSCLAESANGCVSCLGVEVS
jgi:hypothetical protein